MSVVLYVYNGGQYLSTALDSILGQTHPEFEVCVVDDGSTDQTAEVLAAAQARDPRVRVERQEHHGSDRLHETFNNALAMTKYELIAIANADDIWRADKLELQVRAFNGDDHLDICFHDATFINTDGRVIHGSFRKIPTLLPATPPRAWQFISGNPIPNPTAMFRRSILANIGLQELGQMHDHQFWFKATVHGCKFLGLPDRLMRYRVHHKSESTSTDKKARIQHTHRFCTDMMVKRYGIDMVLPELALVDDLDSRAWAWSFVGVLHWSAKSFGAARAAWTEALGISDNAALLSNLGVAALLDDDRSGARQLLRSAADAGIGGAKIAVSSPELAGDVEPLIWHGPAPAVADIVRRVERGEIAAPPLERPVVSDMFIVLGPGDVEPSTVLNTFKRAVYERTSPRASLTVLAASEQAVATVIAAHDRFAAGGPEMADLISVDLRPVHVDEAGPVAAAFLLEGSIELEPPQPASDPAGVLSPPPAESSALLPG